MNQTQARKRAKLLTSDDNNNNLYIAGTVPLSSWGGCERGWAVYQVMGNKLIWWEGTK